MQFFSSAAAYSPYINQPIPSCYNSDTGQFYFLYPDISDQFVSDTIISVMLYRIGLRRFTMQFTRAQKARINQDKHT